MVSDPSPPSWPRWDARTRAWAVPLVTLAIVVVLILDAVLIVDREANKYFAYAPGSAPVVTTSSECRAPSPGGTLALPDGTPCVRLDVPANLVHQIDGTLMMVDVLVGKATPWDWILSQLGLLGTFEQGVQLIPAGAVLGSTPASQLACQDAQQMSGSTLAASVVALTRLGYQVQQKNLGATLVEIAPDTPAAASGLQCGDLVTAIDGDPVHTSEDLVNHIHALKAGDVVTIDVTRTLDSGSTVDKQVRAKLTSVVENENGKEVRIPSFLGVVAQTDVTFVFPFDVNIDVGAIGGPSAGLALTLGLLDVLSGGQLTGGHRVAATGTMNFDGTVGDVGGVAQKTVAVRRAGAQLFLVPPQELAVAKSEAGSMKVMAVSTLDQALSDLEAIGGRLPARFGKNGSG